MDTIRRFAVLRRLAREQHRVGGEGRECERCKIICDIEGDGLVTANEYKWHRARIGTQAEVAARLGLHRVTIAKREAGTIPITTEAALAILALRQQSAERKKVAAVGAKRSCPKRKKYNSAKEESK